MGEGLAFVALFAFAATTILNRKAIAFELLREKPQIYLFIALGLWLTSGFLAYVLGGEGWLKPSELAMWSPFLAIPLIILSSTVLPVLWIKRAVFAFMFLLLSSCVFALVQFLFNVRPGETLFRAALTIASQDGVPGNSAKAVAGGFYYHRLKLAHVILPSLGFLIARQWFASFTYKRRFLELGLVLVFWTTLLLTYSRAALLASFAGALACVPFVSRRWYLSVLLCLVTISVLIFSHPSLRQRLISIGSAQASSERALIWSQAIHIIDDHPLGVGLGNYPKIVSRYMAVSDPHFHRRPYPHNILLATWVETGPVGTVAYFYVWLLLLSLGIQNIRKHRHHAKREIPIAAATAIFSVIAYFTVGLTHDVLFHKPVGMTFTVMIALVLVCFHIVAPDNDNKGNCV